MLAAFGLAEAANRQVKLYSGGMRRRLDISQIRDDTAVPFDPSSRTPRCWRTAAVRPVRSVPAEADGIMYGSGGARRGRGLPAVRTRRAAGRTRPRGRARSAA